MRIVSWNVNGLRASIKSGFLESFRRINPDILGIQETKLQEDKIPVELEELSEYYTYWSHAERKGYSGTALFTRIKPLNVTFSIGDPKFDTEGRTIVAEYEDFYLFNIYFPNGQMNEDRLRYKLDFYDQCLETFEALRKTGKHVMIMGDYNTAHKPIDLKHPKANEKYSGFLPIERAWLDKFVSKGYVDTFRHFDDRAEQYSWWSYMRQARANNVGWRIDYVFVNKEILERVTNAFIMQAIMGSDHCPVGVEVTP